MACDTFTVETLALKRRCVLFVVEFATRRVHGPGCPSAPDAAWVTQQASQVTWQLHEGDAPTITFLLHDRDGKFGAGFDTVVASDGIAVLTTPMHVPNANAVAEQVRRSSREECLDRLRILHQAHHGPCSPSTPLTTTTDDRTKASHRRRRCSWPLPLGCLRTPCRCTAVQSSTASSTPPPEVGGRASSPQPPRPRGGTPCAIGATTGSPARLVPRRRLSLRGCPST